MWSISQALLMFSYLPVTENYLKWNKMLRIPAIGITLRTVILNEKWYAW
jgi:hypothetical protein